VEELVLRERLDKADLQLVGVLGGDVVGHADPPPRGASTG
jgi:hypothetical protein